MISRIRTLAAGVADSGRRIEVGVLPPDQLRRALHEWHPGRLEIDLRGMDRLAPDLIRLLVLVVTRQRSNGGIVALVNASPSAVRRLMRHGLSELVPATPHTGQDVERESAEADRAPGAA